VVPGSGLGTHILRTVPEKPNSVFVFPCTVQYKAIFSGSFFSWRRSSTQYALAHCRNLRLQESVSIDSISKSSVLGEEDPMLTTSPNKSAGNETVRAVYGASR